MKRSPAPEGPIRYLLDPWALLRDVLRALKEFAAEDLAGIALAVGIGAIVLVGWRVLLASRDRPLRKDARRVRILPPPEVDPQQARLLWMSLHALLRPWWKRLMLGQPYIGFEFVGRPEEIEVALWVPDGVPKGLVERAVEVAFPGARTENVETDSIRELPSSGRSSLEACEFGFAEPEWFPIGGEAGDESLSLALAALTGLGENERAFIQLLARPVTSRARYRLVRAARVLRAGGRPVGSLGASEEGEPVTDPRPIRRWRATSGRSSPRPPRRSGPARYGSPSSRTVASRQGGGSTRQPSRRSGRRRPLHGGSAPLPPSSSKTCSAESSCGAMSATCPTTGIVFPRGARSI